MSKRMGVTLVELAVAAPFVVTTGTVFLLLSAVYAPRAKSTYCMTTLNALNKSAYLYVEMNRGYLMSYTHARVPGTELTEAAPSADHTAVCFAGGARDPKTGLLDARGFGRVYAGGFLGPPEMFYCPEQARAPYRLQDYPKPWGSAVPQGAKFIFGGYMYNPWVKKVDAEGRQFVYEDGLIPNRHPNERFLTADLITGPATIAHGAKKSPHWNAGFADGHCEKVENKPLAEMFAKQPQTDWNSWEHWGAASADGQEPGPETVRYQFFRLPEVEFRF